MPVAGAGATPPRFAARRRIPAAALGEASTAATYCSVGPPTKNRRRRRWATPEELRVKNTVADNRPAFPWPLEDSPHVSSTMGRNRGLGHILEEPHVGRSAWAMRYDFVGEREERRLERAPARPGTLAGDAEILAGEAGHEKIKAAACGHRPRSVPMPPASNGSAVGGSVEFLASRRARRSIAERRASGLARTRGMQKGSRAQRGLDIPTQLVRVQRSKTLRSRKTD